MKNIQRRDFLRLAGLGAAGAALFPRLGPGAPVRPPNLVILLADDRQHRRGVEAKP